MLLSIANFWNLKLNIDLDDILKFSSYVRENTQCLHYQANQLMMLQDVLQLLLIWNRWIHVGHNAGLLKLMEVVNVTNYPCPVKSYKH